MYKIIDSFRDEYFFLSNFYPVTFEYDGIKYLNSEAAFQAQKTLNIEERKQFSNLTASEAKKKGRHVQLRKDWEAVKLSKMGEVVSAKFMQNPELAKKLLKTGDAVLIENNTWGDTYWGKVNGYGQNTLGNILMILRKKLSKYRNIWEEY